jgi:hypothetical protein
MIFNGRNLLVLMVTGMSLLIYSCGSEEPRMKYFNDIDNHVGWNENVQGNIIFDREARSGKYVCKIDNQSPYSVTFELQTMEITDNVLKRVNVSAWVKIDDANSEPLVVVDILDKDRNSREWIPQGLDDKQNSVGKWVKLSSQIDLTSNNRNQPQNSFRIYVSNGSASSALVDDIEVVFKD